ncbi:hypothetical protein BASA81_005178 [Batrachochytrium salamandrivorans]|nr:hypothetical protein BASA81_005178 [Batrachochytrium salamandrivorans]
MRCSTPRIASAWNFIMDQSFLAIKAEALVSLDSNWFTNSPFYALRKLVQPKDFGACQPQCTPAQVMCCFSTVGKVLNLFVNDLDITASVHPFDKLNDSSVIKTVTFDEPSSAAALAIMAF